jgi:hypothetical protein
MHGSMRGCRPSPAACGEGWARNTINTTVFRNNALVTHLETQYIAYYDAEQYVVLGKRRSGSSRWTLQRTPFKGRCNDAHNVISIMLDGDGYVHVAWDHHGDTPCAMRAGKLLVHWILARPKI